MKEFSRIPSSKLLMAFVAAGTFAGAGMAASWPRTYHSSAVMRFDAKIQDRIANATNSGILGTELSIDLAERIARLRRDVRISVAVALAVESIAATSLSAQRITAAVVDALQTACSSAHACQINRSAR